MKIHSLYYTAVLLFVHLFIHLSNQSFRFHSFDWLGNPKMSPALDQRLQVWLPLDAKWREKKKRYRKILLFFPGVPDMKTNLLFLMSEEWFCILSLQVTRYTDPGDIWKKLKLRGGDTRPAAPSTSSYGQPAEESRLNVSIPSSFIHFSVPHSFHSYVRSIWSYLHVNLPQKRNKLLLITIIMIDRPRTSSLWWFLVLPLPFGAYVLVS